MNWALSCVAVGVAALIPACGPAELSGPPSVRLGRDECAGCGMLISEDHCSCAMLVAEDGGKTYLIFDDLGCLLDYRADHPQAVVAEVFAHDYSTGQWVQAATASYLSATSPSSLNTPMGSGIVAFASRAQAEAQQKTTGGDLVSFDRLADLRRDRKEAARTSPSGPP
jgi:nitrous oxide reductase accessory protein NosL